MIDDESVEHTESEIKVNQADAPADGISGVIDLIDPRVLEMYQQLVRRSARLLEIRLANCPIRNRKYHASLIEADAIFFVGD